MTASTWLILGILSSGLLAAYAWAVGRGARRTRRRAEELTRTKERLEHEIEERTQRERILEERNKFLQCVVASFPYPFHVIDAADYSIVVANSKTAAFGPWQGATCHTFTHNRDSPCDSEGEICPLAEIKKTKKPTIVEHLHYEASGEGRHYELHAAPILDKQGNVIQMLEYSVDITGRKKNEEKLAHYQEHLEQMVAERTQELEAALQVAEGANRAKSDFLAIMSHELRTPLTGILGFSEILIRQAKSSFTDKQKEFIDHIHASGLKLLTLVDDILDLSQIEAGKIALIYSVVNIKNLIERIANLFRAKMQQHDMELIINIDNGISAIQTDERQLKKILGNLLSNAVKFSAEGSTVTITVQSIREINAVKIAFTDTGIGIPREHLDQIFEPFSQVDPSITRRYGGIGLGLASTKHLVKLLRGEIGVESLPGSGSTFWITLPQGKRPAKVSAFTETDFPRKNHARILLAEDNPVNLTLAQAMLESLGYQIETVRNGREAVAAHGRGNFDLILMDCQMPELDGFEATQLIRAKESAEGKNAHIPIIALTAHVLEGDRENCLASGMNDYLGKPFRQERLRVIVERWLIRKNERILGATERY